MKKKSEPPVQERQNFHFNFDWDGMEDRQEPLSKRAKEYVCEAESKSTKKTLFWLRGVEETAKTFKFTQQLVDMGNTAKTQALCLQLRMHSMNKSIIVILLIFKRLSFLKTL